jgi:hypothetical protein
MFRSWRNAAKDGFVLPAKNPDAERLHPTGWQRVIEMKLKDATRERLNEEGLKVKSSFNLPPGSYLVRIVVRESEGTQMAALNRGVVIP